ncbi:MAG: hypothetical protein FWF88_08360, partial [Peptococcaceae bacterium]|nr:hypothetical protein [Peptococcaceae bacterium]
MKILNIGILKRVLELLWESLVRLETSHDALTSLENIFSVGEGALIENFREQKNILQGIVQNYQEQFRGTADLLDEFIETTKSYLNPIDEEENMVIDSRGLGKTIEDIREILDYIRDTIINRNCNSYPQTTLPEERAVLNEDINRSNIAAINEITQRCLILYNKLENLLHELEEIKNNHFDPFDKFDAEIADRTLGFYSTHVDADFIKQLEE